jgi:hypothetical protein
MKRWMLSPLAVLMLWPANLAAQEEAEPTWWAVFAEQVEPADMAAFEEASAAMFEMIKANAPADLVYYTLSGPETGFMYAIPMESYEQFMEIGDKWEGMVGRVGLEKWMEMDAAGSQYVTSRSMTLYIERMDLSYVPANPRLTAEEAVMRHYDYIYPVPGKEQEVEALFREWVQLYQSGNADSGWMVYQAFTGDDLPLYVIGTVARNRGDYEADGDRLDQMFGDVDDALMQKTWALLRKFEHKDAYMRPELSLIPEGM